MVNALRQLFKAYINSVKPYEPGKPIKELERELGLRNVIKLASKENPLGASGKAVRAMRRALSEVHLYPESKCFYLVKRLAQELKVDENQIVVGNGSNEIIELVARGFISEGDEVVSSEATFLVYPILTQVCGAKYVQVPMKNYNYDLDGIVKAITERTKVIFIANPNNPTGTYLNRTEIESFIARVPEDVLICFDEAYVDFVEENDFPKSIEYLNKSRNNILILRTFSKAYGLAGVRIGYGLGSPKLIEYLHKIRQPFNVNSIAQAGATAALDDKFFLWRTKLLATSGRKYLYRRFERLGLKYLPSQANFILVDLGFDGEEAFQWFLREGMIVRSMRSYGFPTWIRVTIGRRSQNAQFYKLLKKYLKLKKEKA